MGNGSERVHLLQLPLCLTYVQFHATSACLSILPSVSERGRRKPKVGAWSSPSLYYKISETDHLKSNMGTVQSATEQRFTAMRPPKFYLVVVSYSSRLFHSTSWFYPRKMSRVRISGAALAAVLTLIVCASVVSAAPYTATDDCHLDGDVMTLCQRCAKTTKSPFVYPMCCQNQEEAREWCERYLNFGIQ